MRNLTKRPRPETAARDQQLLNATLAVETARATIAWATTTFGSDLCLLSSMQDATLIDLAVEVDPSIDIVFLDNGHQFPETLAMVDRVEQRYGITVRVVRPSGPPGPPASCCNTKVELLEVALAGKAAWMSGIRRVETTNRRAADLVETDRRGLTKVNPIVAWTDADAAAFIDARAVPVNPLIYRGYPSIGCAPCTSPAESDRDGRWAGEARTECGLHL